MNNEDNNLDLLDLDDADTMDTLPDAVPFAAPRPKKPWLLLGVGIAVIMLATYIIVSVISDDSSSSSIDVDLDVPAVVVDGAGVPVDMNIMPTVKPEPVVQPVVQPQPVPQPVTVQPVAPQPAPQVVVQPQPESVGVPVRVVEERKEVTFNPTAQQAKPAAKPVAKKPVAKTVAKPAAAKWYVQYENTLFDSCISQLIEVQNAEPHLHRRFGYRPVLLLHLFLHQPIRGQCGCMFREP